MCYINYQFYDKMNELTNIDASTSSHEPFECPICMDTFSNSMACKTNCEHMFCSFCITKLYYDTPFVNCALCRTNITEFTMNHHTIQIKNYIYCPYKNLKPIIHEEIFDIINDIHDINNIHDVEENLIIEPIPDPLALVRENNLSFIYFPSNQPSLRRHNNPLIRRNTNLIRSNFLSLTKNR